MNMNALVNRARLCTRATRSVQMCTRHSSTNNNNSGVSFELNEQQLEFQKLARAFVRDEVTPHAAKWDVTGEYPKAAIAKAHALGLLNTHVPTQFGGLGLGVLDNCIIDEEFAFGCSGFSTACSANSLAAMPVLLGGNDAQKKKYLGM